MHVRDQLTLWKLAFDPWYQFGEAYSDGRIQVDGDLTEFLTQIYRTSQTQSPGSFRYPRASWKGHSYALYDSQLPVLLDDGVVLVGDAAGLAYGQSGEGIRPAVESALMAAETIIAATGHYDRNQLMPYQSRVVARFGTPQRSSWLSAIPSSWRQSLGLRLITNSWFARHVILDQWFLHRDQPAYRTRVIERSPSNVACAG